MQSDTNLDERRIEETGEGGGGGAGGLRNGDFAILLRERSDGRIKIGRHWRGGFRNWGYRDSRHDDDGIRTSDKEEEAAVKSMQSAKK